MQAIACRVENGSRESCSDVIVAERGGDDRDSGSNNIGGTHG